jgi:small subunit ribosomal protein S12
MSKTLSQIIRNRLKTKPKTNKSFKILGKRPMIRGVCLKIDTRKPKKPNSATRKVARLKLSNGKQIIAYIPGIGHNLQEHSYVLVRSGNVQDLPGVNFKIIRGVLDTAGVSNRKSSTSKYGVKKKEK